MRAWLVGSLLALWLCALAHGLTLGPGSTPGHGLNPGPDLNVKANTPLSPGLSPGHTHASAFISSNGNSLGSENHLSHGMNLLPSNNGISSNTGTIYPVISDVDLEQNTSTEQASSDIFYIKDVEEFLNNETPKTLQSLSSKYLSSPYIIRKCCPRGEYMSINDSCKSQTETRNISDPWRWIDPANHENLYLDTLTDSQVFYGRTPSCGKKKPVAFNFSDGEVKLHRRQDGFRLEVGVETYYNGNDTTHEFSSDTFCLDVNQDGIYFAMLCPCAEVMCLQKCCAFGFEFDPHKKKCVKAAEENDDWLPAFDEHWKTDQKYYTMKGFLTCAENEKRYTAHDMLSNQSLTWMSDGSIKSSVTGKLYPRDSYCGELTPSHIQTLFVCEVSTSPSERAISITMGVLLAIGSLALLLTVCISCALPDTRRRLHGRMALMHNVMLLIGYVSTGPMYLIATWHSMSVTVSKVASFVIQFSFLSAFFWLNVMCIDIAMAFGRWRPVRGNAMQQEGKKFLYYSVYAWGSVILISLATAVAEFVPGARPRPAFGEMKYFFNNDAAMLLFFYGPMALLLVANVALFVYTAVKIKKAAQESSMVLDSLDSRTTRKNKFRLAVYAKLSTLMGVTWVFEVLSWAIGGDARAWVVLDAVNLLRAVFIFILFCCNERVYKQLILRVHSVTGRSTSLESAESLGQSKVSRTTVLDLGNAKRSMENVFDSSKESGKKVEDKVKPSRNNLKDTVRPSCEKFIDSGQQPYLKDTQL